MFKELKMKIAGRRVNQRPKKSASKKKTTNRGIEIIKNIISFPCRTMSRIWKWVRQIDLIGLINLTLLLTIIILFSMLILDICKYRRDKGVVIQSQAEILKPKNTENPGTITSVSAEKISKAYQKITLPLATNSNPCIQKTEQPRRTELFGTVIVDGQLGDFTLRRGTKINGNLYIQNMRKYTLACDTHIVGDLFIRNVNMLNFCGNFTITGNIYVNRNSSFGPIPKTARLGGQIIL